MLKIFRVSGFYLAASFAMGTVSLASDCVTATTRLLASEWAEKTTLEQQKIRQLIERYRANPQPIPETVFETLIFDEERPWILDRVLTFLSRPTDADPATVLSEQLTSLGLGPAASTRAFEALQRPTIESWRRAFGDLSFVESTQRLNESIQAYLQQSGARAKRVRFPILEGKPGEVGPERWVIPVNAASFELFQRHFMKEESFFHLHSPMQGTLMVGHAGKGGSYARLERDLRAPSSGAVWPMILLNSVEAGRLRNFFDLGARDLSAQLPWNLKPYCATGGYSSCTHWFGNIPLGEKISEAYAFPGRVDSHAANRIWSSPAIDALPRVQRLQPYELPTSMDKDTQTLIRRVWTVPGRQALHEVLKLTPSQVRGELANPGWVLHSLVGPAPADRVPVLFVFVDAIDQELPAEIPLRSTPY